MLGIYKFHQHIINWYEVDLKFLSDVCILLLSTIYIKQIFDTYLPKWLYKNKVKNKIAAELGDNNSWSKLIKCLAFAVALEAVENSSRTNQQGWTFC